MVFNCGMEHAKELEFWKIQQQVWVIHVHRTNASRICFSAEKPSALSCLGGHGIWFSWNFIISLAFLEVCNEDDWETAWNFWFFHGKEIKRLRKVYSALHSSVRLHKELCAFRMRKVTHQCRLAMPCRLQNLFCVQLKRYQRAARWSLQAQPFKPGRRSEGGNKSWYQASWWISIYHRQKTSWIFRFLIFLRW